jgi:hypothetical protein
MKRREFIQKTVSTLVSVLSIGVLLTKLFSSRASALQVPSPQHKHGSPRTEGYGACSVSGCPCPGFVQDPGYSYMCTNCGHSYQAHW